MIKIEKNIPMPSVGARGRQKTYPFDEMEVGDSFYVEDRTTSQISSLAYNWKQRHGSNSKFVVKQEGPGARIWRYQ